MTQTIEEDMEFVVYFVHRYEDFTSRLPAYEAAQRVQECLTQTRRQNTDLQENNTKLVFQIRALKARIADLEAQLAEAREAAVG